MLCGGIPCTGPPCEGVLPPLPGAAPPCSGVGCAPPLAPGGLPPLAGTVLDISPLPPLATPPFSGEAAATSALAFSPFPLPTALPGSLLTTSLHPVSLLPAPFARGPTLPTAVALPDSPFGAAAPLPSTEIFPASPLTAASSPLVTTFCGKPALLLPPRSGSSITLGAPFPGSVGFPFRPFPAVMSLVPFSVTPLGARPSLPPGGPFPTGVSTNFPEPLQIWPFALTPLTASSVCK
mmetsp:Transcript_3096/g.8991  ORF Transcript_3096/g.8991 Transcript_3096/m.8991 type:complete len:236 (-) Transcript_3096:3185-3892(-)